MQQFTMASRAVLGALSVLVLAAWASGQAMAAPVGLDALERTAYLAEGRDDLSAAADAFEQIIVAALAVPDEELEPEAVARAEIALGRMQASLGTGSTRALADRLASLSRLTLTVGGAPRSGVAMLEALRRRLHSHALADLADLAGARLASTELGYAPSWWVLGPLENARGTGWDDDSVAKGGLDLGESHAGKERPVSWRQVERLGYDAYVDFDAIMTPNDEAMAYALGYVSVEQQIDVAIRMGSDEGSKVWVNGALVMAREARRPSRFDQDHAAATLEPGWNRILVKVSEGEGEWKMALRITDPAGGRAPIRWLAPGEPAPTEGVVAWDPERSPPTFAVSHGALDVLLERDAAGEAWASRALGIYLDSRHAHDRGDFPHRDAFQRAVERAPEELSTLYYLAQASQSFAERDADREENDYRVGLEQTLAAAPDHVRALVDLADYYRGSLGINVRARALYERALEVNPASVSAQLGLAAVLGSRDWPGEEHVRLRQLLAAAGEDSRVDGRAASLRQSIGDRAGAIAIQERLYLQNRRNRYHAERLVEHYRRTAREDAALGLLAERRDLYPLELRSYQLAAEILAARDEVDRAAAILDEMLVLAPENVDALRSRAILHRRAGDDAAAVATIARLLEVRPGDVGAQDYLDLLEPGEPEYEERFLGDLAVVLASALEREHSQDEATVGILDRRIIRVHSDGTSTTHVQQVRKVTSKQGIQEVSNGIWLEGWGELDIIEARIHGSDGVVRDCKHRGRRVMPPPPVKVGDVFEIVYRHQDTQPSSIFDGYYGESLFFGSFEPLEELEYILVSPLDLPLHFSGEPGTPAAVGSQDDEEGVRITAFTARDLPRTDPEPLMPPRAEIFPQVQVSTYGSWSEFARWWWGMIRKQYVMTEDMRVKVAELTAGLETQEEQVAAIYHFVTNDIRYVAWEFGVHGYKPYESATIFNRRFGDCKDKAILMNTMFEELGIEAYPVLIRLVQGFESRGEEDLRLPTLAVFNHCISMVRLPDGREIFLDGTANNYGFYKEPPEYDRGAKVLVVDGEGGSVQQVPWGSPDDAASSEELDVRLEETGDAAFAHRVEVGSTGEQRWRAMLELEEIRVKTMNRYYSSVLPGASVDLVQASDLEDMDAAVWVETEGRAPTVAELRSGKLVAPLVVIDTQLRGVSLDAIVTLDERKHDLILGAPERDHVVTRYRLPAGWKLAALPSPVHAESEFLSYDLTVQVDPDGAAEDGRQQVLVTREFVKKQVRVPVDRYATFRETCVKIANAELATLTFEKESTR